MITEHLHQKLVVRAAAPAETLLVMAGAKSTAAAAAPYAAA